MRYTIPSAFLFSIFLLLAVFSGALHVHAAACTNTYNSSKTVPTGYGAAYNFFTTEKELLVQGTDCSASSYTVKVGSGDSSQSVYKLGYWWSGSSWQAYSLTGSGPLLSGLWYAGSATGNITPASIVGTYAVGYVCQNISSVWKCGCSNSSCTTPAWQLQQVKSADSGPVCGNGICEAGETAAMCPADCGSGGPAPTFGDADTYYWGMNTNMDVNPGDVYANQVLSKVHQLPVSYIREMLANTSRANDLTARARANGYKIYAALPVEGGVANPDGYGPLYRANLYTFVRTMAQNYGDVVWLWGGWNEPDNDVPGLITYDKLVEMQHTMYDAIKSVNANYLVECHAATRPRGISNFMYEMTRRGTTRYCDVMGFHQHVNMNEDNDVGFQHIWLAMQEANRTYGYPIRPIHNGETGMSFSDFPASIAHERKRDWMGVQLIQMKRFGVMKATLYSMAGSLPKGGSFNYSNTATGVAYEPEFHFMQDAFGLSQYRLERGINGGFETAQPEKYKGWVVVGDTTHYTTAPWPDWQYNNLKTDGLHAKTGSGYYEQSTRTGVNRVRRLVEGLTVGRTYTLTAYVQRVGTATAKLGAMGHNKLNGIDDKLATATTGTGWQELSVTFTPTNPWVVISLEHNGQGTLYWDDVTVE